MGLAKDRCGSVVTVLIRLLRNFRLKRLLVLHADALGCLYFGHSIAALDASSIYEVHVLKQLSNSCSFCWFRLSAARHHSPAIN